MSRSKVLLVAVAVAVLAGGAGAALAAGRTPTAAPRAIGANVGPTTSHDLQFVPVEPCRIADTRSGGGAIAADATRNFLVSGETGFAAQGGTSTGCGVPEGALAAELTVISINPAGNGLLRAFPFGGSPTATTLSYRSGGNTLSTGTIALCDQSDGACPSDLGIKAFQTATQVAIDVNGYYMPNRFAFVAGDGTLISGARVEGVERTGEGLYEVTFDSDLTGCAALATGSDTTNQADLWTRISQDTPTVVELDVESPVDTTNQQDNEFYLHVVC